MVMIPDRTGWGWNQWDAFAMELAECETELDACSTLRLTGVVVAPLAAALCLPTAWFAGLCWLLALWLFFPLLRGWGYSYLAIFVAVLPWYILMEFKVAPVWALVASSAVTLSMLRYLWLRLKRIELYRLALGSEDVHPREEGCYRILS